MKPLRQERLLNGNVVEMWKRFEQGVVKERGKKRTTGIPNSGDRSIDLARSRYTLVRGYRRSDASGEFSVAGVPAGIQGKRNVRRQNRIHKQRETTPQPEYTRLPEFFGC